MSALDGDSARLEKDFPQLLLTANPRCQDGAFCLLHMISSQEARRGGIQRQSVWI